MTEVLSEIRKLVTDHIAKIDADQKERDALTEKLHKAELYSVEQYHKSNALLKQQENAFRAEIDEEKRENGRLQSDLVQATVEKVRLQARFDQATAEKERLQTELAQEKAEKSQNMIRFVATIGLVLALVYGAFGFALFTRMKKMESFQAEMLKELLAPKFKCLQAEYLSESSTAKDMIPKHELETLRVEHLRELEAHKDELERLQSMHKKKIKRYLLYVVGLH
jgi:hypothetical protein